MCKELFIAFLYFLTIFIVNFFLVILIKSYLTKIFYFTKLKNIARVIPFSNNNLIPFLYFYNKYKEKIEKLKQKFPKELDLRDSLIIGNIYGELIAKKSLENFSSIFYYKLQQAIYLPIKKLFD